MLSRLRHALLYTLLVLLLPMSPAGVAALRDMIAVELAGPSIDADWQPISSDLRAAERVELVVGAERLSTGDAGDVTPAPGAAGTPVVGRATGATAGCGLVHCRRLSGALLLVYATPPPARG